MSDSINVGVFNVLAAGMSNCGSFVGNNKDKADDVFKQLN